MPNPTTEAELKPVIETPVRAGYCLQCNHKAFEHEIAMNTRQTGQCLVKGCSCMSLDTPSREELGDEVERLINDRSRQAGEIEALKDLLGRSRTALLDWMHTYASDCCDPETVKEAIDRINQNHGTLAYIANLQAAIRTVLEGEQHGR